MAKDKDKKESGVRAAVKAASSDGINKKEINQIQKSTGASVEKIIQQLDNLNTKLRGSGEQTVGLNAGAANMLIKEASKASPFAQPSFGTGNIGKALSQAIGTPSRPGSMIQGQVRGATPGTAGTGYIPGGMQIRAGGNTGVRRQTAPTAPTAADVVAAPGMTPEEIQARIDEGIAAGINDYTMGLNTAYNQQDQNYLDALNNMSSMFSQQMSGMFDPLQQAISGLSAQEPMRLYGAGENYNVSGVRSGFSRPRSRTNYLRDNMSINRTGPTGLMGMATGGLGGLANALGVLGGLTI